MLFLGGVILGKKNENIKANEIKQHLKTNFDDFYQLFLQNMISSIPAPFGPFFSAIFSTVICPAPINEKISQLLIQFGNDIEVLQEKGLVDIEELMNDPIFTSELLYAIQIAMRNTQKEHHKALRYALLNSALSNPPEQDIRKMFFNYIDSFNSTHFKLLKFFHEQKKPPEWVEELAETFRHDDSFYNKTGAQCQPSDHGAMKTMKFAFWDVLKYEFLKPYNDDEIDLLFLLFNQSIKDMNSNYMISLSPEQPMHVLVGESGNIGPLLEKPGKLFMNFITSPLNFE